MSIERPWAHNQEEFDFNAPLPTEKAEAFETIPPNTSSVPVMLIEAGSVVRMSKDSTGKATESEKDAYLDKIVESSESSPDGDWSLKFKGEKLPRHFDRDAELFVVQN